MFRLGLFSLVAAAGLIERYPNWAFVALVAAAGLILRSEQTRDH